MSDPTYHQHTVVVVPGGGHRRGGNFFLSCPCGWTLPLEATADLAAAETALEHVQRNQPTDR